MRTNIILNTDSYKASHWLQLPNDTRNIYSYIESRGGEFDRTLFFGLQMFLDELSTNPVNKDDINDAADFWAAHGEPFNREGWEYIVNNYGGHLPIRIKAIPEGTVIPTHNALVTIENTDPLCAWVTSYIETALLRAVWYPTTVATVSWHAKQIIMDSLNRTSDDPMGQIGFKLHDFGARGVSSEESAGIGGAAHLVNFLGTDTVSGVRYVNTYYNTNTPVSGFSIPAMEHQTVTSWGRDGETDSYRNMLNNFGKPGSLLACVSDSYDLFNAISNIWGGSLKEEVIKSGATVVIRPDSGDPKTIPVKCVELLGEKFGYTVNSKGYKVLNPAVRVIQGDGITIKTIPVILDNLNLAGWSTDNLAFGMGGGLLQQVNRDTLKFAMKASAANVGGEWRDVYKDPITDPGKTSKKGRFVVTRERGKWETLPLHGGYDWADVLTTVYENGSINSKNNSFEEIRKRSLIALD